MFVNMFPLVKEEALHHPVAETEDHLNKSNNKRDKGNDSTVKERSSFNPVNYQTNHN